MSTDPPFSMETVAQLQKPFLKDRCIVPQPQHQQNLACHIVSNIGIVAEAAGELYARHAKQQQGMRFPATTGLPNIMLNSPGGGVVNGFADSQDSSIPTLWKQQRPRFTKFEKRRLGKTMADVILDVSALCIACGISLSEEEEDIFKPLMIKAARSGSHEFALGAQASDFAPGSGDDSSDSGFSDDDACSSLHVKRVASDNSLYPGSQYRGFSRSVTQPPTQQTSPTPNPLSVDPEPQPMLDPSLDPNATVNPLNASVDIKFTQSVIGSSASSSAAGVPGAAENTAANPASEYNTMQYPDVPQVATPSLSADSTPDSQNLDSPSNLSFHGDSSMDPDAPPKYDYVLPPSLTVDALAARDAYTVDRDGLVDLLEAILTLESTEYTNKELEDMGVRYCIPFTDPVDNRQITIDLIPGGREILVTRNELTTFKNLAKNKIDQLLQLTPHNRHHEPDTK